MKAAVTVPAILYVLGLILAVEVLLELISRVLKRADLAEAIGNIELALFFSFLLIIMSFFWIEKIFHIFLTPDAFFFLFLLFFISSLSIIRSKISSSSKEKLLLGLIGLAHFSLFFF